METIVHLDRALFAVLNRGAANGLFDWLMPRITSANHHLWFWLPVALLSFWVLARGSRRARIWLLCAIVAVGLADAGAARVAKRVFNRERPCYTAQGTRAPAAPDVRLVPGETCPGSRSFPSNHASNMMALGVVCWAFTRRRTRWLWFLLPLVIGYSRIYLGYHYPTDVLGGWAFGAAVASVVLQLARRWLPAEEQAGAHPPESSREPAQSGNSSV